MTGPVDRANRLLVQDLWQDRSDTLGPLEGEVDLTRVRAPSSQVRSSRARNALHGTPPPHTLLSYFTAAAANAARPASGMENHVQTRELVPKDKSRP